MLDSSSLVASLGELAVEGAQLVTEAIALPRSLIGIGDCWYLY